MEPKNLAPILALTPLPPEPSHLNIEDVQDQLKLFPLESKIMTMQNEKEKLQDFEKQNEKTFQKVETDGFKFKEKPDIQYFENKTTTSESCDVADFFDPIETKTQPFLSHTGLVEGLAKLKVNETQSSELALAIELSLHGVGEEVIADCKKRAYQAIQTLDDFSHLTLECGMAISAYTNNIVYRAFHKVFLTDGPMIDYLPKIQKWACTCHHFTKGLRALPCHIGKVFRGLSVPQDFEKWTQIGARLTFNGYTSASTSLGVAMQFAHSLKENFVLLRLQSETGTRIAPLSKFPKEEEVVFRSGTVFRVVAYGVENLPGGQNGQIMHVIDARECYPRLGRKVLLWVEDNIESVRKVYDSCRRLEGVTIVKASSTIEAIEFLSEQVLSDTGQLCDADFSRFRIVQDMARKEPPIKSSLFREQEFAVTDKPLDIEAGKKLIAFLTGNLFKYRFPICIFSSKEFEQSNKEKLAVFGKYAQYTWRAQECYDFASFKSSAPWAIDEAPPLSDEHQAECAISDQSLTSLFERWLNLSPLGSEIKEFQQVEQLSEFKKSLKQASATEIEIDSTQTIFSIRGYEVQILLWDVWKNPTSDEETILQRTSPAKLVRGIDEELLVLISKKNDNPSLAIPSETRVGFRTRYKNQLQQNEKCEVDILFSKEKAGTYLFDNVPWNIRASSEGKNFFKLIPLVNPKLAPNAPLDCGIVSLDFYIGQQSSPPLYSWLQKLKEKEKEKERQKEKKIPESGLQEKSKYDVLQKETNIRVISETDSIRTDQIQATLGLSTKVDSDLCSCPSIKREDDSKTTIKLRLQIV